MAWRNQGITGSNNIPLGTRRRFGGSDSTPPVDDGGYNPSQPLTGISDGKRGRSPERGKLLPIHLLGSELALTSLQLTQLTVESDDARREIVGEMPRKTKLLV